ncbi:MAG: response regulator transcription factor [Desulfarculaceae bacterium]|jgi:DNA-binding NarL/FixJ family response regulator
MPIRIILADDHKIMRKGLKSMLKDEPDMEVAGEAEEGRQALDLAGKLKPDLVIMDITMPGLNGIEATRQMVRETKGLKVIGLSMHRDARYVVGMLEAGAKGYLLKDCDFSELIQAIHTVTKGGTYLSPAISDAVVQGLLAGRGTAAPKDPAASLTPREREVVQLLSEGYTNRKIADRLCVSVKTVETHRQNVMQKLNLRSLADLTKFALRQGITSLEE